jgi:hypothetical protein
MTEMEQARLLLELKRHKRAIRFAVERLAAHDLLGAIRLIDSMLDGKYDHQLEADDEQKDGLK